jgi:hypothetical protein
MRRTCRRRSTSRRRRQRTPPTLRLLRQSELRPTENATLPRQSALPEVGRRKHESAPPLGNHIERPATHDHTSSRGRSHGGVAWRAVFAKVLSVAAPTIAHRNATATDDAATGATWVTGFRNRISATPAAMALALAAAIPSPTNVPLSTLPVCSQRIDPATCLHSAQTSRCY